MRRKICARCGKEIPFASRNTKYCTACRVLNGKESADNWYKKKWNTKPRICIVCNKEIDHTEKFKKVCGKCRDEILAKIKAVKSLKPAEMDSCAICGKPKSKRSRYCLACSDIVHIIYQPKYDNKHTKKKKKPAGKTLDEFIAASKKAGMSYGKYMGMRRIGKIC